MSKLKNLYLVSLVILLSNFALAELSPHQEERIPFHAHLTEEFKPANAERSIPAGFRFVVLRPLDGGMVLGDFPRRGIYPVEMAMTDIEANLSENDHVTGGRVLAPRMSYFFANKIISGESDWLLPLRTEAVNNFSRWIIVYGNSDQTETIEAIRIADAFYRELSEEERSGVCLVYLDPLGNKSNIASIAEELDPTIQSMPGYLSRGYSRTLSHIDSDEDLPLLVEVESSGRVVSKNPGLEQIAKYFTKLE